MAQRSGERETLCELRGHSWRSAGFTFVERRDEGGIANRIRRVCERCHAWYEQTEVSWPNDRITVEDVGTVHSIRTEAAS